MKNHLAGALLLSLIGGAAQAQLSAGTKLLTGSVGYNQIKQEIDSPFLPGNQKLEAKTALFNFNPSAGYFIADNLALGISAGVGLTKSNGYNYYNGQYGPVLVFSESKERALSAGAFGRYYKFVGDKVALYGQVQGGYQNIYRPGVRYNSLPGGIGRRNEGLYAGLLPGIVFFPTNNIGLELTLRGAAYNRLTNKPQNGSGEVKSTDTYFDFGFGLNDLNLGISLYLGRN
ncbi:hypothetical protein D0T11_04680 [Hymenobacter rubripertinctus]|uniref:Outer membrane protein beta-barrel domain-containing protein n=2 Tax=Hymenobacter rubripertinctus TaxID=2029981 RepID=A0A418R6C2_9BACT|nr:hypothetical protein D0T11_04680 [Hymenobacter rubripertinctus]